MQYLEVTKDNHQNALDKINKHAQNGGESVIALTAPWCGHCNAMKPELVKMKSKLRGGNGIVANVSDKYHSQLKMDTTVDGFPTIRHFKGGDKVKDYEGKRVAADLADFANSSLNTTMIGGRRKKTRKRHRKKHKKTRRRKTKRRKSKKRRRKTRRRKQSGGVAAGFKGEENCVEAKKDPMFTDCCNLRIRPWRQLADLRLRHLQRAQNQLNQIRQREWGI